MYQTSTPHQREDIWPPTSNLMCSRLAYTMSRQWNWVSNLEPSSPEVETLPLGHRGSCKAFTDSGPEGHGFETRLDEMSAVYTNVVHAKFAGG
ncbi:hypothetical protein AVEN_91415-1 [Araneus ventricosus]|uniref:Uncharacterized protein n=1 Tax=Araneus ventricosus TaxID=182803 RepID=A0A4Y2IJA6_ARAVE|nr:hypothetical protein AVEN_91415-1 [Araneus ventricosus]